MKILITGATGYVAQYLGKELVSKGHSLYGISRNPELAKKKSSFPCEFLKLEKVSDLKGVEAVINLAGASVAGGRWTKAYKKELKDSRIKLTSDLIKNLDQSSLKVFLSASAIGYYADGGDKELTEEGGPLHDGFIGELCRDWENVAKEVTSRLVSFRIGVVLGEKSAALMKMSTLFKLGAGARLGNGEQFMSFIHVKDLSSLFIKALENEEYSGVINAVSPEPMRNKDFTKLLAKKLKAPLISPPVPAFALKLLYGEMAQVLLRSHRVIPKRALELGFSFKYGTVDKALGEAVKK